jgi:hypothetical protein
MIAVNASPDHSCTTLIPALQLEKNLPSSGAVSATALVIASRLCWQALLQNLWRVNASSIPEPDGSPVPDNRSTK